MPELTPEQQVVWDAWDRVLDLLITIASIPELEPLQPRPDKPLSSRQLRYKLRRHQQQQQRKDVAA